MGRPNFGNKYAALSAAGKSAYQADCAAEDAKRTDYNHPITSQRLIDGYYDKF